MSKILNKILLWVEKQENIRALILTGSRASEKSDPLSDYDLTLFCKDFSSYAKKDVWIHELGKVWVSIEEKMHFKTRIFPTRLVVFEDGINFDFSFFTLDVLNTLIKSEKLLDPFYAGYKVLIDKDGITNGLKAPSLDELKTKKPTKMRFISLIEEFWFEMYQMAKGLKREDLWMVKFRDSDVKERLLLQMIQWNEGSKHRWNHNAHPIGKRMKNWVSPSTWKELQTIYSHFDAQESWKALESTIELFRKLSIETAKELRFSYPHEMDQNITGYIQSLKSSPK